MSFLIKWFTRISEFIAAMALAAIFFTFLLQIFTRYAPKIAWLMPIPPIANWMSGLDPIGWTVNLISLIWVWLIFFGCSFIVREKDHVSFNILYLAAPKRGRQVLAVLTALILLAVLVYSFLPTWDFVFGSRLMELKKIQTLRMPITGDKIAMKWLFAPLIMLMVVLAIRSIARLFTVFVYGPPGTDIEELVNDAKTAITEEGGTK